MADNRATPLRRPPRTSDVAIETETIRQCRRDGPADIALPVTDHQVLMRDAHSVGNVECRADRFGSFEFQDTAQVYRCRIVRDPTVGQFSALTVAPDDGAPDALLDDKGFAGGSLRADALLDPIESSGAFRRPIQVGAPVDR